MDSTSGRSTGTSVPKQRAGDGTESCKECGDVFDELAPPFCANCGAKTKYFAAAEDENDELPVPEEEDFGREMLDELLDELRSDTASSGASARSTGNKKSSAAVSRDTFALKGDERFSEREAETTREAKSKAKAKAKAVGAKPAIGGIDGTYELLQEQIKKKQAEKAGANAKTSASLKKSDVAEKSAATNSRSTFAAAGDERFSERAAAGNKKPASAGASGNKKDAAWEALQSQMKAKNTKPLSAKEQHRVADDLDAELASLEAEFAEKKPAKQVQQKPAAVSKPVTKTVKPIEIPESLNDEAYNACLQLRELLDSDLLDVNEYNSRVEVLIRQSSQQKKEVPAKKAAAVSKPVTKTVKPIEIPESLNDEAYNACLQLRELFDNDLLDVNEYNSRVEALIRQSQKTVSRSTAASSVRTAPEDDFDSELAALEADLGENLSEGKGRVTKVTASLSTKSQAPAPKKKISTVVTEKASGGPALPEGLSWHQTPVKSEMARSTFAHKGDDRFSERPDALPTGVLSESPAQACNFCHKEIAAGQKFKTGLGALWHNDCFKCGVCLKSLEKGMKFFK
jgi:hypothetical protein